MNQKTDADILEWAREQKYGWSTSIQRSIKALIRQEIAKKTCNYRVIGYSPKSGKFPV